MRDGSSTRASGHLASARAARRRIDLDAHAAAVQALEDEIDRLPSAEAREVTRWEVAAERLRDIGYHASDEDELRAAADRARQLPEELARERPDIAARMRLALGQVHASIRDNGWAAAAADELTASARKFIEAREPDEAAAALSVLAWSVQLTAGELRAARESLTEALSLTTDPSLRAAMLSQRAQLHVWLGLLPEAQADIDAAWPLSRNGDDRAVAYVAWVAALIASLRGQRAVVESWVRRGDERRGNWADGNVTGIWYDTVMTDALARVGAVEDARGRLARLLPQADREPTAVGLAQVSFEARWGDPAVAAGAWEDLRHRPDIEPWEIARLRLLTALGDERTGGDPGPAAAEAFDLCAGLEQEAVLLSIEPAVARQLLSAAAAAGSVVASRLLEDRSRWSVRLLGGFAVSRPDGTTVALPDGVRRLLQYLAVADAPVPREAVVRWLWPEEVDGQAGRKRLRQLLHRTRGLVPDIIVVVEPERLRLAPHVTVDLTRFAAALRRARSAPDEILRLSAARGALAELGGELLPDEVLDTEWLQPARTRLALDVTWLHTTLAEQADGEGQDQRALTHARAALAADPTNETAAALAIDLLRRAGQRGQAQQLARSTQAALAALDLQPGPLLRAARERLRQRSTPKR